MTVTSFDRYDWEEIIRARTHAGLNEAANFKLGQDFCANENQITDFRVVSKLLLHPRAFQHMAKQVQDGTASDQVERLISNLLVDNADVSVTPRRLRNQVFKDWADASHDGRRATAFCDFVKDVLEPLGFVESNRQRSGLSRKPSAVVYQPTKALERFVEAVNTDQEIAVGEVFKDDGGLTKKEPYKPELPEWGEVIQ